MSQLEESARIVLDGIHGQSNPEISIDTRGDDLLTLAEVALKACLLAEETRGRNFCLVVEGHRNRVAGR